MQNLPDKKAAIYLAAPLAAVAFGVCLLQTMPLIEKNALFIPLVPAAAALILLAAANVRVTLSLLFLTRALLDPLFNMTKVGVGGENIGFGGLLNALIIVYTVFLVLRRPKEALSQPETSAWGLFLLVCLASVFYSPVPGKATKLFLNIVTYACMALLPVYAVNGRWNVKYWMKVLFFSSFLPVLVANLDLAKGGASYNDVGMRIKGSFTHPNILAFYLVFVVMVIFYTRKTEIFRPRGFRALLMNAYTANVLLLLLATKTRSAWISCWLFFLVYGLLKERKYVMMCIAAPVFSLALPQARERIVDLFTGTGDLSSERLNSMAWRWQLWTSSLNAVKKRFLFGYGLSSFEPLSGHFFALEKKARRRTTPISNFFLKPASPVWRCICAFF